MKSGVGIIKNRLMIYRAEDRAARPAEQFITALGVLPMVALFIQANTILNNSDPCLNFLCSR
jgi:hypothetical protein